MIQPDHSESAPPDPRRLWKVLAGLSILVVALAVFAWQQGGDRSGPLNTIAAAAERTGSEQGGRATVRGVISSPARPKPVAITGQMVFDGEGRTEATVSVPRSEGGGSLEMESITDGTVMYTRSDQAELPEGKKWLSLDLALGEELKASAPADVDAKGELELLEEASGGVQNLGKEDVRGVPTTHYRGSISVSKQVERLREDGADDLASIVEKKGSPLRVEAWVDAEGLVRRMRLVHSQPSEKGDGPVTIDTRMDLYDFGLEPEIEVPDSSEVFDETPVIRKQLGVSGD